MIKIHTRVRYMNTKSFEVILHTNTKSFANVSFPSFSTPIQPIRLT